MKKILIAAFIVGAAATALILLSQRTSEQRTADDITDTAEDVFDKMNKTLKHVENKTEQATGLK